MAVGDLINYTNIVATLPTSWMFSNSTSSKATHTWYISSPCFRVYAYIKGSGWWGYQSGGISIYPYDPTQGKFGSAVYSNSYDCRGGNSITRNWYHNYNGGSPEDIHDVHLWKIVCYIGDNDGSGTFKAWTGGMGMISQDIYTNYFQNRPIYYSSCDYWVKGNTYSSDSAFLEGQGYSSHRGTQISISTETYKNITAKHL